MQKVEDPILRIIRQQKQSEKDVSRAVRADSAKQRDSGDSDFHHQGPQTYGGGNFGYGTKDKMPGTTPMPQMNPIDALLEALRIRKFNRKPKSVKIKGTGNLI